MTHELTPNKGMGLGVNLGSPGGQIDEVLPWRIPSVPSGGKVHIAARDIVDEAAQTLVNRTGNADVVVGSSTGVDTNDPKLLSLPRISYDGSDDYTDTGHVPEFNFATGAFCAVGHIAIAANTGSNSRLVSTELASSVGMLFYAANDGTIIFTVNSGLGVVRQLISGQSGYRDGVPFLFAISVEAGGEITMATSRGDFVTDSVSSGVDASANIGSVHLMARSGPVSPATGDIYEFYSDDKALSQAECKDFVNPPEGWTIAMQNSALGRFPVSSMTSADSQSIANLQGGQPAVLGSVRGAEITETGLYQPGIGGHNAACISAEVGIADATVTSLRIERNVIDFVGTPLLYIIGSSPGRIIPQTSAVTMHLSLYDSVPNQQLKNTPLTDAATKYGIRYDIEWDRNGPNIPRVEYWYKDSEVGEWIYHDFDDWSVEIVRPGNDEIVTISNASEIEQHRFEIINDGVPAVTMDFRDQEVAVKVLKDEQGNDWTINGSGVDTNDPRVDLYEGTKFLRYSGEDNSYLRSTTVDFIPTLAEQTIITWVRGEDNPSDASAMYMIYTGTVGARFRPGITGDDIARVQLTRTDTGGAHNLQVTLPGVRFQTHLRYVIDWNHGGILVPRLTIQYLVEGVWEDMGSETSAVACGQPSGDAAINIGHPTTAPTLGDTYYISLENDGVESFAVNPDRDHESGDSWTDSSSGRPIFSEGDNPPRIVTENALVHDGTDDLTQLPADQTPTFTATEGGYSVWMDVSVVHTAQAFARLFSTEGSGSDGLFVHVYHSGDPNEGRVVINTKNGGTSISRLSSSTNLIQDGERFQVLATFSADTDTSSIRTSLNGTTFTTTGGPLPGNPSFLPPRIGSRAYSVGNCAAVTVYDCETWDYALSTAEIEDRMS